MVALVEYVDELFSSTALHPEPAMQNKKQGCIGRGTVLCNSVKVSQVQLKTTAARRSADLDLKRRASAGFTRLYKHDTPERNVKGTVLLTISQQLYGAPIMAHARMRLWHADHFGLHTPDAPQPCSLLMLL